MSPGDGSAKADVFWRTKEGFEMHLQLNGTSTVEVLDGAHEAVEKIIKAGGEARPSNGDGSGSNTTPSKANPPNCTACGKKMKFREGESKNGKPYKGFFCQDRDCEGKPVWIDD
jgi:hypothetical protein